MNLTKIADTAGLPRELVGKGGGELARIVDAPDWEEKLQELVFGSLDERALAQKWKLTVSTVKKLKSRAQQAVALRRAAKMERLADKFHEMVDTANAVAMEGVEMARLKGDPKAMSALSSTLLAQAKLVADVKGMIPDAKSGGNVHVHVPNNGAAMMAIAFPRLAPSGEDMTQKAQELLEGEYEEAEGDDKA
jgi:hypothetical protein